MEIAVSEQFIVVGVIYPKKYVSLCALTTGKTPNRLDLVEIAVISAIAREFVRGLIWVREHARSERAPGL